ncbi:hypothetical protein PVA45_05315 [Entomospira entomophila]|uniref:Uncharacterized protein n=1 Tax=Entomospira entomophila TaxID=2719988 RepID=A0A968KRN0_9SPIO|nr:hypothetical protein [Entomospira entomophilus]NIZ40918.1 hypothetical protein [Entomospira entomophilus]WDI35131.1 hypothetical protein PVA45_05315 [Entomospira entomophilus]
MHELALSAQIQERLVKLETTFHLSQEKIAQQVTQIQNQLSALHKDFYATRGELKSVDALVTLFTALDTKVERDRQKRDQDHKEILVLLAQKMDSDKPVKWALYFQGIVKYLMWLMMVLTAFGVGNWWSAGAH